MKIISQLNKWYLLQDIKGEATLTPLDVSKTYTIKKHIEGTRTYLANRALHKYFSLVSTSLNDAGYSVQFVINSKRDKKIAKVFDWMYSVTKWDMILKVKEKILSHTDTAIPWTGENVKNLIWRPFQKALVDKQSTVEITSKDIDIIYKTLDLYLTKNYGIESIRFPSIDALIEEQNRRDR